MGVGSSLILSLIAFIITQVKNYYNWLCHVYLEYNLHEDKGSMKHFIARSCYLIRLSSPWQRIFLIRPNRRKIFQACLRHSPTFTARKGLVWSEWGSTVQRTLAQESTEAPSCYWNLFLGAISQLWRISSFCIQHIYLFVSWWTF